VKRKAGWAAVGVVALRDLGLRELEPEVLEGGTCLGRAGGCVGVWVCG
jgi:hypothetical protein